MNSFYICSETEKKNIINFKLYKFGKSNLYTNFSPNIYSKNDKRIFFYGDLTGIYEDNKLKKISFEKFFIKLTNARDINKFLECIEGRFLIFYNSKDFSKIFLDKFSKYDVFYFKNSKKFEVSNNLKLIISNFKNKLNLDNTSISHMLNVLGSRPPKKSTIFENINRLGVNESIDLKTSKLVFKEFYPNYNQDYGYQKIDEYYEIMENYIKNFSKDNNATIFMSSGFDSSFLGSVTQKVLGKKKTNGVNLKLKYSERSGVYNKFEVQKVKKIADFLGIDIYFDEINLNTKFHKYAEETSDISSSRMLPMTLALIMHNQLSKLCSKKINSETLLSGEISDGAHNFGFAQYANFFNHEDKGFREYVDKMYNYIYSPSFFQKLLNGKFENDEIFKFLINSKKFSGLELKKPKDINDAKNIIFNALFLTDSRFPFVNNQSKILKNNSKKKIDNYFYKNYFNIKNFKNSKQLYSCYLHLYNSFHWQAGTVVTMYELPEIYNLKMSMPFWNIKIQDYLSKMPENWGRGLETRTLKYPLKENLFKKFNITKVLEIGPHSYQYDVNKFSNVFLEVLLSKSARDYIINTFELYNPSDYLSPNVFNINFVNRLIKEFKNKNFLEHNSSLIYRLFVLSNMLKGLKY